MLYNIDVYCLNNSNLPDFLKQLVNKDDKIKFKFIKQSSINKSGKVSMPDIILFEEENYLTSIEIFKKIIFTYKKKPASIILSNNKEVFNIVQWIRKGATDYLVKGDFKKENFINAINGSLEYISDKKIKLKDKKKLNKDKNYKPIIIPKNNDWSVLKNNKSYELSLVMFEIILPKNSIGQYSKPVIDKIYLKLRNEINLIAQMFGGKLWYWNNNSGVILFYFGDKINCSVLAAIYFYTHFFQICLENIELNNIPHFKIGINEGKTVFHYINTGEITSDIINSLSHLTKKYTETDNLNISDNVFNKLNSRMKNYFIKVNNSNKSKLYQYQFFNYPSESPINNK